MLKDGESLFTANVEALDFDYLPKLIPFREREQKTIANAIKPIFQKRNGRNVFVHGKPGIGKTAGVRHLLKDLEEQTDDIFPIYINCWSKNTTYKVMLEICDQMGYKFTQNKKTDELLRLVGEIVNKNTGAVIVLDEVDKAEDLDFLYSLLEELYRKSLLIVTNYPSWLTDLDERIKSRLLPDLVEFKPYSEEETIEILRQRMKYAFVSGVFSDDAFLLLARKAAELKDVRAGLYMLRTAGQHAEDHSQQQIEVKNATYALSKLESYMIKETEQLAAREQQVLNLIKLNSGRKIGDIFKQYEKSGGVGSYKTFQRTVKKLEEGVYITVEKKEGGSEGTTSILTYGGTKKLTEF